MEKENISGPITGSMRDLTNRIKGMASVFLSGQTDVNTKVCGNVAACMVKESFMIEKERKLKEFGLKENEKH